MTGSHPLPPPHPPVPRGRGGRGTGVYRGNAPKAPSTFGIKTKPRPASNVIATSCLAVSAVLWQNNRAWSDPLAIEVRGHVVLPIVNNTEYPLLLRVSPGIGNYIEGPNSEPETDGSVVLVTHYPSTLYRACIALSKERLRCGHGVDRTRQSEESEVTPPHTHATIRVHGQVLVNPSVARIRMATGVGILHKSLPIYRPPCWSRSHCGVVFENVFKTLRTPKFMCCCEP